MQAVILAGGTGTRLAPYTTVLPKPLMPVGQMPILELIIRQLKVLGFKRIEMATGYLSGLIEAYFGDGSRWGVEIRYHVEKTRAGTAGPLLLLKDVLEQDFLIMNGDVLTDLDFAALLSAHCEKKALLTIATCQRDVTLPLGAIVRLPGGGITDYIEKPTYHFECSAGIYAGNREIVSYIDPSHAVDLPDLVRILINQEKHLASFPITGFWLDIGTPEDYRTANEQFETRFAHLMQ
ncbi:MAG TPA: sugar phosphate nucleotidyltransferase [Candidatus Rubrimentiphilum sp.]|nr:sugar phosphate nucleotidyltransferase [Candidatus Rubrimentiphilum sp.]